MQDSVAQPNSLSATRQKASGSPSANEWRVTRKNHSWNDLYGGTISSVRGRNQIDHFFAKNFTEVRVDAERQ
jgi:hypothetical protein